MAVAFDAAATGTGSGTSPITWSHTCTGSGLLLLVDVAYDNAALGGTRAVSYIKGGSATSLTSLGTRISGGAGQTAGWVERFMMIAPDSGAHTVTVSWSGVAPGIVQPASLSFTGADQVTGVGTLAGSDSAGSPVTSGTVTVGTTTSGGLVVGGWCDGSAGVTVTAGTQRVNAGFAGSGAAGNLAVATSPSTGGSVSVSWTQTADFYGALGVEVLAPASGVSVTAAVAAAAGVAPDALTSPHQILSPVAHASAVAILPGGYGTWGTPEFAEGGP